MNELVLTTQHDKWTEIALNEPSTRNAITGILGEQLATAIERASADSDCEVILLRGEGGAFCSGLNLKEFNREPPPDWMPRFGQIWRRVHSALFNCKKPIVVALEKFAINGGAALALAADLLVVGADSFLQVGEVRQGMAAPYNVAWLRLRCSENVIAQLVITGKRFTGEALYRLGVAYAAPPTSEVVRSAHELCQELATYPSGALATIKSTMRSYHRTDASAWFDQATNTVPANRPKPQRVT